MDRSWRSTTLGCAVPRFKSCGFGATLKILYTRALLLQKNNSGVAFRKVLLQLFQKWLRILKSFVAGTLSTCPDCIYFSFHNPFWLMLYLWCWHFGRNVILTVILFTLTSGVPFLELVDLKRLTTILCKLLIFLRLHSWDLDCRRHWSVFSGERVLAHLYV
jgi:hypothetical protein